MTDHADKTKFTPGPWEWDCGDSGTDYNRRYCDIYVDGGNLIIASVNDAFDREEGHANARLMKSAPALYRELTTAYEVMLVLDALGMGRSEMPGIPKLLRDLAATLAAARGEE